jgi:hypothetical protein
VSGRHLVLAASLAALALASGTAGQEVVEEPSVFPEGPYRDEVFYLCTACHSSRLVRNQAMSRERWDETLTWMSERHGMPELEGEERAHFLDYLTAHFGPAAESEQRRAPFLIQPQRKNPFAPG